MLDWTNRGSPRVEIDMGTSTVCGVRPSCRSQTLELANFQIPDHDANADRSKVSCMRKQVILTPRSAPAWEQGWLDLNKAAWVEVSWEDEQHPIEFALLGDEQRGWRAAGPGAQTIRLIFDSPQRLRRIWLAFEESEVFRTQEFVLRWTSHVGRPFREIVR